MPRSYLRASLVVCARMVASNAKADPPTVSVGGSAVAEAVDGVGQRFLAEYHDAEDLRDGHLHILHEAEPLMQFSLGHASVSVPVHFGTRADRGRHVPEFVLSDEAISIGVGLGHDCHPTASVASIGLGTIVYWPE